MKMNESLIASKNGFDLVQVTPWNRPSAKCHYEIRQTGNSLGAWFGVTLEKAVAEFDHLAGEDWLHQQAGNYIKKGKGQS